MKTEITHLPGSELEIMMALWECGAPATRSEIEEKLTENKWAPTTVLKFLSRLTEKGFISCEQESGGKKNIYSALVSEDEYLNFESASTFGKLCGHSVKSLVANLYENNAISDSDLSELVNFIDSTRKNKG